MKTFKDLEFNPHTAVKGAVHARLSFDNGTFISVVGGADGLYGNGITSFEVLSTVTENTVAGVNGWLSIAQVTNRMRYLQTL
jgi:hypothetical protein|tara:strand:+ start:806 stop:1051 length:246 start_codon:yes stop_codon:yes gene_type:complete